MNERPATEPGVQPARDDEAGSGQSANAPPKESGGPKGLEPTRYGDWERNGRCFDF